jgi:hypothetical protein
MSTKNVVFNKLFKAKTNLSKKVDLGQVDDLMSLYDQNYILEGQMLDKRNTVNEAVVKVDNEIANLIREYEAGVEISENLLENNEKMSQILADIDIRVGELGIDSSDVVPDYNKIVDFIGNTEETVFSDYITGSAKNILNNNY